MRRCAVARLPLVTVFRGSGVSGSVSCDFRFGHPTGIERLYELYERPSPSRGSRVGCSASCRHGDSFSVTLRCAARCLSVKLFEPHGRRLHATRQARCRTCNPPRAEKGRGRLTPAREAAFDGHVAGGAPKLMRGISRSAAQRLGAEGHTASALQRGRLRRPVAAASRLSRARALRCNPSPWSRSSGLRSARRSRCPTSSPCTAAQGRCHEGGPNP